MNFDRLAPHYDWMEAVTAGGRLQRARTAWLDELHDRPRILSVGEGHGRFAEACVARFPDAELTVVESSPRMLARAQSRLGPDSIRVRWHRDDLLTWEPETKYDAVVTCFFLDCFPAETLSQVVAKLASCASNDVLWLIVDFAVPPKGPARWRARAIHALMYGFFRQVTNLPARRLTPPDALLETHGFRHLQRRDSEWGLLRADLWHRH